MEFHRIGVVGAGTMGAGIAEVLARAGCAVVVLEASAELLERGLARLDASLARAVERGKLGEGEREAVRARVSGTLGLADLAGCDLVIEAVSEDLTLKEQLFAEMDALLAREVVLASNTSSLPVVRLAAATQRPERVVGLHFFNPAPVMRLVEVVRTVRTAPEVVAAVTAFARALGKVPVVVGDRAGFLVNRLLCPYLNHAAVLLDQGAAARDAIDAAVVEQLGHPMGPFALMDLIGLDVMVAVMDALWAETRARRHAAAPLLRELATAGMLGRKAQGGFYGSPGVPGPERGWLDPAAVVERLLGAYLADAAAMVGAGFAQPGEVDLAMRLGCGHPEGPGQLLSRLGGLALAPGEHDPDLVSAGLARLRG